MSLIISCESVHDHSCSSPWRRRLNEGTERIQRTRVNKPRLTKTGRLLGKPTSNQVTRAIGAWEVEGWRGWLAGPLRLRLGLSQRKESSIYSLVGVWWKFEF